MNNQLFKGADQINWKGIFLYYMIAVVIALPFNSSIANPYYLEFTGGTIIAQLTFLPACLGTLIAALVAFKFDVLHQKSIDFFGNHTYKNTLIALVPLIVLTIFGIDNTMGWDKHIYAFTFVMIILVYSTCEEIFWRGYLQDALRPLSIYIRFTVLGVMWWAWHFPFNDPFGWTGFLLLCLISAFLIGKFAEESKSYFTTGGLHCLVTSLFNMHETDNNTKMLMGGLTIAVWLGIGTFWKTPLVTKDSI